MAGAIKKILWHTAILVGVAILAGLAGGALGSVAGRDAESVALWCARAYLALALLLPLGLWIAVVAFFDQDRRLYDEWLPALTVTVVPAILGALAARITFVGPATTAAAMLRPSLGAEALAGTMAAEFGWGQVLPVLIATVVGATLIAVWAERRDHRWGGFNKSR